jgi:hypothetical protein
VLLKTALGNINLPNNKATTQVNILLDEGAQRTFITEDAARHLNIRPQDCTTEHLSVGAFGSDQTGLRALRSIDIELQTNTGIVNMRALIVPKISTPVRNYWSIVEDKIVRGNGPTAVASKLGYLLSGPTNLDDMTTSVMNATIMKVVTNTNEEQIPVTKYWDLETVGISVENEKGKRSEFEEYRDSNIEYDGTKYVAGLPWKPEHGTLPTNYELAVARTRAMVKRLSPERLKIYNEIIHEQLESDFIEKINKPDNTTGHYIPHHPGEKQSSSTPIRIVYNCSAKQRDRPNAQYAHHQMKTSSRSKKRQGKDMSRLWRNCSVQLARCRSNQSCLCQENTKWKQMYRWKDKQMKCSCLCQTGLKWQTFVRNRRTKG